MDFTPLTRFIDSLEGIGIPGCDIIVKREHETLYRHMSGWRDREAALPMRGDELYMMYSVTKPVTCAAALQLVERGQMLLSEPVAQYLPEFERVQVREPNGAVHEARQTMLIRHLFSMTAGFDYELDTPSVRTALSEKGDACATRDIVRAIASQPLAFEPGTHWQYSLCHDVLACLVEVVSGQRFCDYVRDNIFLPLGMERSTFHLPASRSGEMAAQYNFNDQTNEADRVPSTNHLLPCPLYDSGGAGLISSVEDYSLFADALACGGVSDRGTRVLTAATVDLMRENQLDAALMKDFDWPHMAGYGYGLGVRTMVSRGQGGALSPTGEFGWGGAAGAYLLIDPENRLSVFYAQHMLNNKEPYVHPRIRNIVYSILGRD